MNSALDRYLSSVKPFLPRAQRDDILRELEENFRSEMEERETELGRPLNEADREAILARHGSPISVASQYRGRDARLALGVELIGPDLFPLYLKWLAVPVALTVALFAAALAAGQRPALLDILFPIAVQVTVVTTIFSVLQVCQKRYGLLDRWRTPLPSGPELVRRYLHALGFWLPSDIVAELGENLRSEIEEREAKLGHALDEPELVAILKAHGDPLDVASRYLPPRYVIGPALFPMYWFVMKLVGIGILGLYVLVAGPLLVKTVAHPSLAGVQVLWNLLMVSFLALGMVTLVFSILERRSRESAGEWDPRRLPAAPPDPYLDVEPPLPWRSAVSGIVVGALFALCWLYLAQPQIAVVLGDVRIAPAPVWRSLFWPILAVLLGRAVVGAAGLARPSAFRLRAAVRLTFSILGLIVIRALIAAQSWIEISAASRPIAALDDFAKASNLAMEITLLIAAVILVIGAVRDGVRVFRAKRAPAACLS